MNKRVICVAALAVLLVAGVAVAKITKTAIEGKIVSAEVLYMGDGGIGDDGILRVRGQKLAEKMVGDLEGTLYVTANFNVEPTTWTGKMWGRLRFEGEWDGKDVVFKGFFAGTWDKGYFDGKWLMRGTGNVARHLLKADNYGPGTGPQVYEGFILAPCR